MHYQSGLTQPIVSNGYDLGAATSELQPQCLISHYIWLLQVSKAYTCYATKDGLMIIPAIHISILHVTWLCPSGAFLGRSALYLHAGMRAVHLYHRAYGPFLTRRLT